ncbi:MAG: M20/M25/M40 family metallo-hydrolase [Meiothermus sp.]|uniref:M20/M25/M40 family metallo-hydrolase n=1 Tax=Meiothermus sp. TaxID=1955249 RepID=UPI0025D22432|nr:M20/M25/M40 family metallo-hydrolase [Meiothermus sp.]MCS7069602.1 M20/M25/M40 family metallo-hydrolase [Meiothermus sp.]MDW8424628.1 M20/M25/M40 family metallo-hydrolase [Meiothermus sp.]
MSDEATLQKVFDYIDAHAEQAVEDLRTLLRQPSVSAQNIGLAECARLLWSLMRKNGVQNAEILPTEGGPEVLLGTENPLHPDAPTLLCYGHYDVQPPEPLELWHSDPWGAEVRDGVIYARGATDNKSGCLAFVEAARAYRAVAGGTPVRLQYLFEGEEEIGSPHLEDFVWKHKDRLHCDASIGLDGGVNRTSLRPEVHLGIKAILYVELRCKTLKQDTWSGRAQMLRSAPWRLIECLTSIADPATGVIKVEGWYDTLIPPDEWDLEFLRDELQYFNRAEFMRQMGARHLSTDDDFELLKRAHYGASANICGFASGYTGEGSKTIVPAEAVAKMDFRCPPGLEPAEQFKKLQRHLEKHGFDDIELILVNARKNPYKVSSREAIAQATFRAAERVFGVQPIVHGVSIQGLIMLAIPHPAVLSGFGAPENNLHGPNENMPIARYIQGIKYAAAIYHEYAVEMAQRRP